MTSSGLLTILGVIVVVLLLVVVFYAYRLAKVSKQASNSASRFRDFMRNQAAIESRMATLGTVKGAVAAEGDAAAGRTGAMGGPGARPFEDGLGEAAAVQAPELVLPDVHLRLSELAEAPIYLSREATGAVLVQIGARQPLPLSYVLDLQTRRVLQTVTGQATVKFGQVWSILASDDPDGNLTLRRLS